MVVGNCTPYYTVTQNNFKNLFVVVEVNLCFLSMVMQGCHQPGKPGIMQNSEICWEFHENLIG